MKRPWFSQAVRSNLQEKYLMVFLVPTLLVPPLGLAFGSFVPLWFFAQARAETLGVRGGASVLDQPIGWLWLLLTITDGVTLVLVGCFLGFLINALILHFALRWSWTRVCGAEVCPGVLVHWLEGLTTGSNCSPGEEPDPDPMYDAQLD
jgi:hypothetical protein